MTENFTLLWHRTLLCVLLLATISGTSASEVTNCTQYSQYYSHNSLHTFTLDPNANANCPIRIVELYTDPDRRFELEIYPSLEELNKQTLLPDNCTNRPLDGSQWNSKLNCLNYDSSPCSRVILHDAAGWSGLEEATTPPTVNPRRDVTLSLLKTIGNKYLVSRSNRIQILICTTRKSEKEILANFLKSFRTPLKVETIEENSTTVRAPWFPNGYIQSGQQYHYTFTSDNHTNAPGVTFAAVLIQFDDLDLDEGDTVTVSPTWTLRKNQRDHVLAEFDDDITSVTLSVNINENGGKWTNKIGWKFRTTYIEYGEDYDDDPVADIADTKSLTQYVDMSNRSSLGEGRRITVTADSLLDHLYVFDNLPAGIRLSVHVIVYTQNKQDKLTMQIRDGRHSETPLIANISSSLDLDIQPKYGYVMSSGAYIRVISHVIQFSSIITFIVTPFRMVENSPQVLSQCCAYPSDNKEEKGGFLCSRVMRCIPVNSACDTVDNCGDGEDESTPACRGERLEAYGMTARNVCQPNAKTVLCPWGSWVKERSDCYKKTSTDAPSSLTLAVAVLAGLFAVGISMLSLYYRRRMLLRRGRERRARHSETVLRGGLSPPRWSRNESHTPARPSPSSTLAHARSDLRLQFGTLPPPSYAEVQMIGKAPPAYRETAVDNDQGDNDSNYQGDHPPAYEIALSHQKADDIIVPTARSVTLNLSSPSTSSAGTDVAADSGTSVDMSEGDEAADLPNRDNDQVETQSDLEDITILPDNVPTEVNQQV